MRLPPELQAAVLACLPPNEQAIAGRLVSRDLCVRLSNRTAQFRLPLPPAACDAAWQPHLHHALKHLTFNAKLCMLSAAAASGSETNLELAWGLLRPCLFPELLKRSQGYRALAFYDDKIEGLDPGTAAVGAGHAAAVLPWLVRHGCPLHPDRTMEAVVQHCDMAGVQAAWQLLGYSSRPLEREEWGLELYCALARAAGLSGGDRAVAKLAWLQSVARESTLRHHQQELLMCAAAGAAEAGSLPVMQWLRGLGLKLGQAGRDWDHFPACDVKAWAVVLAAVLRGGHVAVADWLVDEAGCPLPRKATELEEVWTEAAKGGSVESLRWLMARGVRAHTAAVRAAASAGQLEALRLLREVLGVKLTEELFVAAAGSRSVPTVAWLLQAGCPMDPKAYTKAAQAGDGEMVAWLALEAGCPWERDTAVSVINVWPGKACSRAGLRQAVESLAGAGCQVAVGGASSCVKSAAALGDLWLLHHLRGQLGVGYGRGTVAEAAGAGCEAMLEELVAAGLVDEHAKGGDEGTVGQEEGEEEEGEEEEEESEEEDKEQLDPYVQAGLGGDLATLTCLARLGVALGPRVVSRAARDGVRLPVLRWLVEQGAAWDAEAAAAVDKVLYGVWNDAEYVESRKWFGAPVGRKRQRQREGGRW